MAAPAATRYVTRVVLFDIVPTWMYVLYSVLANNATSAFLSFGGYISVTEIRDGRIHFPFLLTVRCSYSSTRRFVFEDSADFSVGDSVSSSLLLKAPNKVFLFIFLASAKRSRQTLRSCWSWCRDFGFVGDAALIEAVFITESFSAWTSFSTFSIYKQLCKVKGAEMHEGVVLFLWYENTFQGFAIFTQADTTVGCVVFGWQSVYARAQQEHDCRRCELCRRIYCQNGRTWVLFVDSEALDVYLLCTANTLDLWED